MLVEGILAQWLRCLILVQSRGPWFNFHGHKQIQYTPLLIPLLHLTFGAGALISILGNFKLFVHLTLVASWENRVNHVGTS